MSYEEEVEFIKPFIDRAREGEISTIDEIKKLFEKRINKTVHKTIIYRLLKRHNWRKIVPIAEHPKTKKTAEI